MIYIKINKVVLRDEITKSKRGENVMVEAVFISIAKVILLIVCLWICGKIISIYISNIFMALMLTTFSIFYLLFLTMEDTAQIGHRGINTISSDDGDIISGNETDSSRRQHIGDSVNDSNIVYAGTGNREYKWNGSGDNIRRRLRTE